MDPVVYPLFRSCKTFCFGYTIYIVSPHFNLPVAVGTYIYIYTTDVCYIYLPTYLTHNPLSYDFFNSSLEMHKYSRLVYILEYIH